MERDNVGNACLLKTTWNGWNDLLFKEHRHVLRQIKQYIQLCMQGDATLEVRRQI